MDVTCSLDNFGKNIFYYVYNSQKSNLLGIAPWDLDLAFMAYHVVDKDYETLNKENGWRQYLIYLNNLVYRMFNRTDISWREELAVRYWEERNGGNFTTKSLQERFTSDFSLIQLSGADVREESKWSQYHSDIAGEVDKINEFIENRLAYLDTYYKIDEKDTAVEDTEEDGSGVRLVAKSGSIYVYSSQNCQLPVYNMSGVVVATANVEGGIAVVSGLPTGLYIIAQQKVFVK